MTTKNRLANCHNPFQGEMRRVLTVCSAGLLRSPTLAWMLSNPPYNFNTRAAGSSQNYALVPVDQVLLEWADTVVFVERDCMEEVERTVRPKEDRDDWVVLNLRDVYDYRNPELVAEAEAQLRVVFGGDL